PQGWEWCKFGDIVDISRGASPRPINQYITNDENSIPWIKIGDTDIGGKYIEVTKEKITLDGAKKSKLVQFNDFLLTNSMSFGRPYITKISGCVHDGWLVIKFDENIFNIDFLYYLLSSPFIFFQFSEKAAGSAFKNLKSDTVRDSIIPLPPFQEQKRIVEKVELLLSQIEHL
ncbi:restriction endonuclease subunit S, partial [Ursidibacter arcticus]|uniref:restriction endonuclease subunit S n=1 Tax=Ursidibacter arcticus TaxID=1524965 RepID=UPI0013C343B8